MDLGDEADNGVTETPQQQQQQQPNQIDLNELIAKAIKAYEDGKKRKISPEGSDAEQGSSNNNNIHKRNIIYIYIYIYIYI